MTKHASDDPEPVIPLPDQSNVIPLHTDAEINPEDTKTADSNPDKPREAAKGDAEPEPLRDLEKAADAVSDEGSESEDAPSPEEEDYGTDALDDVAAASQKEDFRRKTEPWPNAIDGEQLFADVVRFILRFVVLDAGSAEIVADWILMTYVVHSANLPYAPRLIISAASGNCGKSTLLDVITYLARYALPMAHVTTANYRMEAHRRRCILVDEAQHVLRGRQNEVSELIKLGHSRTQSVVQRIRNVRGRQIIERYNVFGPCVVAGTGNFAPTQIRTRALGVIKLKRKLPHEEVEPFTPTNPMLDHAQARELRMKMNRWALDNHEPIRTYQPTLSRDLFNNRNKDNASTLLKVAETIGPVAGEKCRQAIEAMVSGDVLDPGELLLGHISALVSDPEITVGNPPRRFGSDGMLWSSDLCALLQDYFPDHYEGLKPAGLRFCSTTSTSTPNRVRSGAATKSCAATGSHISARGSCATD